MLTEGQPIPHTGLAALALVLVDLKGREVLDIFKQSAGTAAYDEGGFFLFKLLGNDLAAVFKVVGVDDPDIFNADGLGQRLEVYGNGGVALKGLSCGGVLLMARHAGNAVVENDDGGNTFVVCYVYKAVTPE